MNGFEYGLVTALIWGIVPILEKIGLGGSVQPMAGLAYRSLGVCAGLALLLCWLPGSSLAAVGWRSAAWLMASGCLASVLGQMMFYHSLKLGEASRMAVVAGTYPLVTFLLGVVVLREPLTMAKALGVALIVAGVLLLR
jgi:transporter family protein